MGACLGLAGTIWERHKKAFMGDGKALIMHGSGQWLHKPIHLSKLSNCTLKMGAFYRM